MSLYDSIFYDENLTTYGDTAVDVPVDLKFYRTNTDNVYVFHWGFTQDFITPALISSYDFELQLASDLGFTLDTVSFLSGDAITYQNGDVRKGFAIPVSSRLDKQTQVWYARVRTIFGFSTSGWSNPLPFAILEKFEQLESENIVTNLPDEHVYGKEDLRRAVTARTSNLYTVANMYGKEFDQAKLENILTTTNITISLCRDENLFNNFGILFNYVKAQDQTFVEYRESLRALTLSSLDGGTLDSIQRVIRSFTGVDPDLELIRDRDDFFLNNIFEVPSGLINSLNTDFIVSSAYVIDSLIVLQNGTVLTPSTDFTEDHALPGFVMTVPPTSGDTLQVFFKIGASNDPDPLVFDIEDRTLLTGTLTFTNGSTAVTGSSTLFTGELNPGDTITDSSGLILGVVDTVTDNLNLTLTETWIGSTGTDIGYRLTYGEDIVPPIISWDRASLAHGLIIHVNNPGEFTLNTSLIEMLTRLILPAHILVYFEFA